jgi:NADH:ubiquinone oxidoreductase subunit E/NAD-dependent dihydropyrimidine dehydrogenase PreA subunit
MAKDRKVGAALVVGGGVGGMQAAIDLAESGIKVYLLDRRPSIGGVMAQLDKTFPTNDCAMCTLAPRLVEVGRHKDIELLTLSEVEDFKGEPGNFTVTVVRHPRFILEDKCKGCGECAAHCLVRYKPQFPEKRSAADLLSAAERAKMDKILENYKDEKGVLVSVLQDVNKEYKYLPAPILKYIAERLELPLSQVYHAATFYTAFSLTPRGEHVIKVCLGTACHVRGSPRILDEFERRLGIKAGETTKDRKFTLETVNCLGACAFGPVVVVDEEYQTLSPAKVGKAVARYQSHDSHK